MNRSAEPARHRRTKFCLRLSVVIALISSLGAAVTQPQIPTISTFAGGGLPTPGPATATGISDPGGIGIDPTGNLYFTSSTGAILKVTPAGTLSIFGGTGPCCYSGDGGPATKAQLSIIPGLPTSPLKTDLSGSVYFVDDIGVIRRIDHATGIITTVAGAPNPDGKFSGAGGPATSAQMNPAGLGFDAAGDLFISDYNNVVWRVDHATQVITIVAGVAGPGCGSKGDGGPGTSAELCFPAGLAVDSAGNLFIAEVGDVRRVDAVTRIITTYAGGGNTYPPTGVLATQAGLSDPTGLAFDPAGNLIIADSELPAVLRVDKSTQIITIVAGDLTLGPGFSGDGGPATSAQFANDFGRSEDMDVTVDASGNIFVTDSVNYRVRRIDAATQIITTIAGNGGIGDGGPASQALLFTSGLAHDTSGNVFIGDPVDHRVRRVDAATSLISTVAGKDVGSSSGYGGPATAKQLNSPGSVAVDGSGDLFISDHGNDIVEKVNGSTGIITLFAGTPGSAGFGGDGGPATSAELNTPRGVAVDTKGNLYIADNANNVIRKVDASTGIITTTVGNTSILSNGTPVGGYSGDGGPETSAQLLHPFGGTLDSAADGFIADRGNNIIRRVGGGTGIITTIAGNHALGPGFSGDNGPASQAQLNGPSDAALDSFGNLYISDSGNYRVRMVNAVTGIITTLAGNGNFTFGGDGGPAAEASLWPYQTGLTVLDPDPAGNIRVLVMDGTSGRTRLIMIPPVPAMFLTSTSLSFGNQAVSTSSAPQLITIANSGTGPLNVMNIAVTGVDAADFAISPGGTCTGTSFALAPTASCTIAVTYAPGSEGQQTASLTITDNSAGSPHTVTLQGNGGQALVNVSPNSVTFFAQLPGTTSSSTPVTITNVGDAPLMISKITPTAGFGETDNCNQANGIAPSGSCTINVTFTPTASGVTKGTLTIASNASGGPQVLPLQGTGDPPGTPAGPYAYVPISSGHTVMVFDVPTELLVTTINVGQAPFAATDSPNGQFVYVSNSNSNSVSVINAATNTVVATVPVGPIPGGFAITPDSSTVYVSTHGSNSVSVINAATNTAIASIPVGTYPFLMAANPNGKLMYVTNFNSASVSVISTATNTVVATIPVGVSPQGIAISSDGKTLYVACTTSEFVSVINTATDTVSQTIPVPNGPLAITLSPDGSTAFVSEYFGGATAVINLATKTVTNTVPVGTNPYGSAVTPDGSFLWQSNSTSAFASIISTQTDTVVGTIPVTGSSFNIGMASSAPMTQSITQPLSPTQPNQFNFGPHNFTVQYPPGTSFSNVNMTVAAAQTSEATFAQRVAGTVFANATCIVYSGAGGNCVDYQVTCTNTSGSTIACPSEPTPSINVKTSYDTLQTIVNPGFLTAPIGTNQWQNIFTAFYLQRIDPTTRGRTVAFSEFFAVDLGATNGQGVGTLQFEAPLLASDSRVFPAGTTIPVQFQLTSVAHPGTPVTDAVAGIAVVMVADGNGNPVSNVVLEKSTGFTYSGNGYGYQLNTTGYAPGTYNLTVYGNAFAAQQVQFTLPASTTSAHLVTTLQSFTLNTSTNQYAVVLGLSNPGTTAAGGLLITSAQLNSTATTTILPLSVGDLGSGATATATLTFPASAGAPATRGVLNISLSYAGGTAGAGFRVTLP
jgi:YVTN family beta-propeller protein